MKLIVLGDQNILRFDVSMNYSTLFCMLETFEQRKKNFVAYRKWKWKKVKVFFQIPVFVVIHDQARSFRKGKWRDFTVQLFQKVQRLHPIVMTNLLQKGIFLFKSILSWALFVYFDAKVFPIFLAKVDTKLETQVLRLSALLDLSNYTEHSNVEITIFATILHLYNFYKRIHLNHWLHKSLIWCYAETNSFW